MSFRDLIALVLLNLNRMRSRVVMTAMGVVVGTAAIVILISLASGLQESTVESFEDFGTLNQITVFSSMRMGGIQSAEGLTAADLASLRDGTPSLAGICHRHGEAWVRFHVLRLCLLDLARLRGI